MDDTCLQCHLKTVDKLISKFKPSIEVSHHFVSEAKELLASNKDLANPYVATYIQRLAKEKLNVASLYRDEKIKANSVLLSNYDYWMQHVTDSSNAFLTAVKLAMAGNIIDFGAHTAPDDIEGKIEELIQNPLSDDEVERLYWDISKAEKILYLGDNAGEIVFDKLLLEIMAHNNVTYAVRGKAVINDVTFDDVDQTGIDQVCKVISNGYDAPSTLLEHCSKQFLQEYHSADLVISKGQGNFEGLMKVAHPNTYFLLTAKCEPIAQVLDVKVGDLVIRKQRINGL